MKKFKKHKILIYFIIWSIWISLEFLIGPYSHVRIHDAGDSLLPQLIAAKYQFANYGISYFADYMVSGVDAMSQSLVPFSNINSAIFTIFPGWFAYGLLILIQRFIAGYFTYRLVKDYLRFRLPSSVIAGLLFSLFNFSIYSFTLYHALGIPALPLILWFLEKIKSYNNPRRHFYTILFGTFIGFSNYFVYFSPYLLPFIFVWFIYIRKDYKIKTILNLILFSLATILPMVPNIFATIYNSQLSQRTIINLISDTFHPQGKYISAFYKIIDTFKSYYLSIIFVVILAIKFRIKDSFLKKTLLTFLFLIAILLFYKLFQPHLNFLPKVIRSFTFDRLEFIIPFVLSISVAALLNQPIKKLKNILIIFVGLIFVVSLKIKFDTLTNYAPYRSLYNHPDLVTLANSDDSTKWRVATVTGGGVRPAYPLSNGLYTVDSYLTLYPKTYHAFWSKVIKKRLAEDKSRWEDYMDWGNRVYLYGPDNFESLESVNFESYYNLELLSKANVKYIISTKPLDNANLKLMKSQYREDFAIWDKKTLTEKVEFFLQGKFYGRPYYIYENRIALPRFYFEDDSSNLKNSLNIISYTPDKIVIEVNTSKEKNLIAGINYYPWWKASINGHFVPISKYKDAFMGLKTPAGRSTIILEYKPDYKI